MQISPTFTAPAQLPTLMLIGVPGFAHNPCNPNELIYITKLPHASELTLIRSHQISECIVYEKPQPLSMVSSLSIKVIVGIYFYYQPTSMLVLFYVPGLHNIIMKTTEIPFKN